LDALEPRIYSNTMPIDHMSAWSAANGTVLEWMQWQLAVLAVLRADFIGVLQKIDLDDVDWDAWRRFYSEGRTPRSAVDRALERDF
jgi:hypothetical protein